MSPPDMVEQAGAAVYVTTKISEYTGLLYSGYAGSGSNATWLTRKGPNTLLNFFDGSKTNIIANSVYNLHDPEFGISGRTVVFTKNDDEDTEVYRFKDGVINRLTENSSMESNVLIDGNAIVWKSWDKATQTSEVYLSNGTTSRQLTNNKVSEEDVRVSGSQVAWAAWDGNDVEIYLHDGNKTRALTNNTFDDYSPVLKNNKVAWMQWNGQQEDLFCFDGNKSRQITTDQDIRNPMISGNNLVYQVKEAPGAISLQLFNTSTKTTRQLSSDLSKDGQTNDSYHVEVAGNLIAWEEENGDNGAEVLKLFNGTTTATISTEVLGSRFFLKGSKLAYISAQQGQYTGDLFVFDNNSSSASSTQVTADQSISPYSFDCLDISGNSILWKKDDQIFLSQPASLPTLTFASQSFSVVEGFSTPQTTRLNVTLSSASTTPVSVRWETWTNVGDANQATQGSDYTAASGTLTFAAGVTSQTISVPILNDALEEPDEVFDVRLINPSNAVLVPGQTSIVVSLSDTWQASGTNGQTFSLPAGVEHLSLLGKGNINGSGNSAANIIHGNNGNNRLSGGSGADRLTGRAGADRFDYRILTDSLLGSSMDTITDFNANNGGDKFLIRTARSGFLNAGQVTSLNTTSVRSLLSARYFPSNAVAFFQMVSGSGNRSFVAINNGVDGFDETEDALIDVTGLRGSLNASHFVTA